MVRRYRPEIFQRPAKFAIAALCLLLSGCASTGNKRTSLLDEIGDINSRLQVYERLHSKEHTAKTSALGELKKLIGRANETVTRQRKGILGRLRLQESNAAAAPAIADGVGSATRDRSSIERAKPVPTEVIPPEDVRSVALFRNAYASYQRGEFKKAQPGFKLALEEAQTNAQRARCLYWLGQTHYVQKEWEKAAVSFRTVHEQFPATEIAPSARLKEGYALLEQGDLARGKGVLERLIRDYPDADETHLARERLERLTNT